METIGFIGLGRMGSGMAGNIQKAGYPMIVHDVREEAAKPLLEGGARLGSSPAEVASLSDVIFTSLPMPPDVEEVLTGPEGVLQGIKQGSIHCDLSTSRPDLIRRLEPMFRQRGAHVLDTPVMASPASVLERSVLILAGGEREIYDQVKPILDSFADRVMYCGGLGSGLVCKLVNNMMGFGVMQVIAEGLTLGTKAGVDLETLLEAGQGTLGGRRAGLARTVFSGQFEPPSFTLALSRKDIGLATELGRDVTVPMPVANLVEQLMMQGMNRGWAEKDYLITFLLQEDMSGVQVRSPEAGNQ
jgi:3-hydroxyisobutyrate dehydrogenase